MAVRLQMAVLPEGCLTWGALVEPAVQVTAEQQRCPSWHWGCMRMHDRLGLSQDGCHLHAPDVGGPGVVEEVGVHHTQGLIAACSML